jgi:hypothetical protein
MYRKHTHLLWIIAVLVIITLPACGGGGGATATGVATVSLTDAPGDFDHVWITVKDIWFHTSNAAGPGDAGWFKFPLATPVTVDLLTLSNGTVGNPIWGNITLPVGNYQQIRLILAGTEDPLTGSASGLGLQYNNEVEISAAEYPLGIPDARHGIRLLGAFQITDGGTLRLAIDFDAGHDVVDIQRTANNVTITEYILKPRLAYCDLDDAGAIVSSITPTSAIPNARFVFKAEQLSDDGTYHVVKRSTMADPTTGKFVLYPLKPGTYDIVMRGIGYRTVIIKGVPVTQGTMPALNPTTISPIAMTASFSSDYPLDGTIISPTGAWVNFYQTLPGEVPYEIRFRHFNPITGKFIAFQLSKDPLQVGTYVNGPISLVPATPVEGAGQFSAVTDAILYDRSASQLVSSGTTTASFSALSPTSPPSVPGGNSISGTMNLSFMGMGMTMNKGILFAVHGGMIVNTMQVDTQMMSGGAYAMSSLPGGSPIAPMPGAFYGVEALGWSSTGLSRAVAVPCIADLRTGNATGINMTMVPF